MPLHAEVAQATAPNLVPLLGPLAGALVALTGVYLGSFLTERRERRLALRTAIVMYHVDRRDALATILAGLYSMDLALTQCELKRQLAETMKENAAKAVQTLSESILNPEVGTDVRELLKGKLTEISSSTASRVGELQLESFADRSDHLKVSHSVLVAAIAFGDYPREFLIKASLAGQLQALLPQVTSETRWTKSSKGKRMLYDLIDDVGRLVAVESTALAQARRGGKVTYEVPTLDVLAPEHQQDEPNSCP